MTPTDKIIKFLRRQGGKRCCGMCLVEILGIESVSTVNEITRAMTKDGGEFQRSPKERCSNCGHQRTCIVYGG